VDRNHRIAKENIIRILNFKSNSPLPQKPEIFRGTLDLLPPALRSNEIAARLPKG